MNAREFDLLKTPLVPGRALLIEANAGTGKTFNIQHLYLRLLLEQELDVGRILVVTFTEAATAELRDRIRGNLAAAADLLDGRITGAPARHHATLAACLAQCEAGGVSRSLLRARVKTALGSFDEAAISTIHGFCHRILAENAFDSGAPFDRTLLTDTNDLLGEFVSDFYRREVAFRDPGEPFQPNARECSRGTLMEWARCFLRHPDARMHPASCDPEAAARQALLVARSTPLPKRNSRFKDALQRLHDLPEKPSPTALAEALSDGELGGQTAYRNAPDLALACLTVLEAPAVALRLKLRAALDDPETGLDSRKARRQVMTFDDLLQNLRRALRDPAGTPDPEGPLARILRQRFRAALIDEFQDTDPVQYEIFTTIFDHPECLLFMIGDPKQAIYGFRGGDIYAYLAAAERIPEPDRRTLSRNYRAAPRLIEAVNHIFDRPAPFAEPRIGYIPSRPPESFADPSRSPREEETNICPLELVWVEATEPQGMTRSRVEAAFAHETAERIVAFSADHAPEDMAVLVPTHAEAERIRRELARRRVPAVVYQSGNVFSSDEAFLLAHLLSALETPGDPIRIATALMLLGKRQSGSDPTSDSDDLSNEMEIFHQLRVEWIRHGILRAFGRLEREFDALPRLARGPAPERALTNMRHLLELLHQQEAEKRFDPETLARWLHERIDRAEDESLNEAFEQRLETDRRAVTVMTLHKSKGLEFPVVFCPCLGVREIAVKPPQICHDPVRHDRVLLPHSHASQSEYAPVMERETLSEQLRLIYVGLTRAANRCVVLAGNFKPSRKDGKYALQYLLLPFLEDDGNAETFLDGTPPSSAPPVFKAGVPITVHTLPETGLGAAQTPYEPVIETVACVPPGKPRRVPDDWAIMSYSSLGRHDHAELPDDRAERTAPEGVGLGTAAPCKLPEQSPRADDPYAGLPPGNQTGLCLHAILEQIDFRLAAAPDWPRADVAERIRRMAFRFGLCRNNSERDRARLALLARITGDALRRDLSPFLPGFRLADLAPHDCRSELTFDFAVPQPIDLVALRKLGLRFQPGAERCAGFMTGSIDLVFRRQRRYYFLDWKSDFLGGPDAYRPERLRQEMNLRGYTLQAMIYAVALHRFLRCSLGACYDPHAHFGGGLYLLLRGLDAGGGLHEVRPSPETLSNWESIFCASSFEAASQTQSATQQMKE